MNSSLAKLDIARKALAESKTLGDILKVRDASVAFDQYARATKMGAEALAHATEIKLLAERKAGEKLAELEKDKGRSWKSRPVEVQSPYRQTLEANSISKDQAARWQRYAKLDDSEFEEATKAAKERVLRASDKPSSGGMDVHYSSETPEWETPNELFELLDSEFHFELDVCATPGNAKCSRFFSREQDALKQKWTGSCWMNPPYGDEIPIWIKKAWDSSPLGGLTEVVCLLPARVDTAWWWDYCRFGEIRFLRGRVKFGGGQHAAPFPSAVVIFPRKPATIWWDKWQKD